MIDPTNSLVFSMHANKGVYAVLLGSGVSRAARIPTGWEITIELVRKVAALQGANCEPDPAGWFLKTTGNCGPHLRHTFPLKFFTFSFRLGGAN